MDTDETESPSPELLHGQQGSSKCCCRAQGLKERCSCDIKASNNKYQAERDPHLVQQVNLCGSPSRGDPAPGRMSHTAPETWGQMLPHQQKTRG